VTFATMSAATLGEGIDLAIRFTPSSRTSSLRLNRVANVAALVSNGPCDTGDARDFLVLAHLVR